MSETNRQWGGGLGQRVLWLSLAILLFGGLPMLGDHWAYEHLYKKNVYDADWARMLRVQGFAGTWLAIAIAMWLQERGADAVVAKARAWYLIAAVAAGGLLAEVMKLLLRRQRPESGDGEYVFRPWSEHPFSTSGLAWPSSHTMLAFAAATAMSRLYPRTKWVWFVLAAACGVTRIMARAHFLSDVTLGALLGWCVGWGVWFVMRPASIQPAQVVRTAE